MSTFVLILLVTGAWQPSLTSVEFGSHDACRIAGETAMEAFTIGRGNSAVFVCVPKGEMASECGLACPK